MNERATRRRVVAGVVAALLALAGNAGVAQNAKPIRILVGFPAGGGTDGIARTLADRLKEELNTPVVVENRAGAGGQIAAQALKAAPADGRTYLISHDHTISILPLVVKNPGFDPAQDFVAVAGFATFVNAFALSASAPAKSFDDHLATIRASGGKSAVGVPAPSSVPEFLVKLIGEKHRIDLVPIPYRGSAPMLADLMAAQIPAAVASVPELVELHKAGKARVVAVLGAGRQAVLPNVPTFTELGLPGFEDVPYYGFFAAVGTPQAEIDRFAAALSRVIAVVEVKEKLTAWGLTVEFMPGAQLAARERAYAVAWGRIIRASGFQPQ